MALLIRNLSQIATPTEVRGRALRVYEKAVIVIDGERFAYLGPERDKPSHLVIDEDFDARGAAAIPGFVDSHTHLPFAGFRESEFNRRLNGETYEQMPRARPPRTS